MTLVPAPTPSGGQLYIRPLSIINFQHEKEMKSIGFIGAGNMGFALAKAAAARFPGITLQVVDVKPERVELFRRELPNVRSGGSELGECRGLLVSIAAGVTLARMEQALPRARLVRVIPNTPCLVGEMAAGYAFGSRVIPADKELVRAFLAAAGRAMEVEERLLDAVTGLSGSGPAFVARLMEAFIEAGRRLGLKVETARELALQTFRGTAGLLQQTGMSTQALVDMVSSPKGTTLAGRAVLEASDLAEVIYGTVAAAARRAGELARS
jgi:pyrroline-5-carboxylate reductase